MDKRYKSILEVIGVALTAIGIVLACVTLVFGDNLYQRITERSFPSDVSPSNIPATPTLAPAPEFTQTRSVSRITPIIVSTLAETVEPYSCPFTGNNDQVVLLNIVEEESRAALNQDFDTLKLIYFPDAIITDDGRTWHDPNQHYNELFNGAEILEVNNSNIRIQLIGNENAIVYRTVSGSNLIKSTREIVQYTDDSGYITFKKDADGCWRIIRFDKAPNGYR